ncbi:50S ribosomal protein L18e [Candidatus Micrarchaeota archaeon]|nr:MAG: 50S ribosomal protein L18e [Candidatus Micrarchaeota archaeon]
MKRGTTNPIKKALIVELERSKRPVWKVIAEKLRKPRRKSIKVNLWKVNKLTSDGDTVIIPGKVLGMGEVEHNVTVAAFSFSESARKKLGKKAITIAELLKKNPEGKNIKIIQ